MVFFIVIYFIYKQVIGKGDVTELYNAFVLQFSQSSKFWFIGCLFLMPVNWLLETRKWQLLVKSFYNLNFKEAFKGILSGLSLGIITPQRIGEYGGRILVLPSKFNWEGVSSTFLCSIAQNMVNVALGLVGAVIFLQSNVLEFDQRYLIFIALAGFILLVLLYFLGTNLRKVKNVLADLGLKKMLKPILDRLRYLKAIPIQTKIAVINLSLMRYVIYVLQYVMILFFFGIDIDWVTGITGVSLIYLLQTGIPLPPLLGIAARGEIALFIWGQFDNNSLGILSASYLLWIINLIIPSLLGLFFVLKTNILGSLGYEKE